jgi:hypothetical protein
MIVSFILPAAAAFWLGIKKLQTFMKHNKSSNL